MQLGFVSIWMLSFVLAIDGSDDVDLFKQELVKEQFRDKLLDHFRHLHVDSVIMGAGYHSKSRQRFNRNSKRILGRIEEIQDVPSRVTRTIKKLIIPGRREYNCQKSTQSCWSFRMDESLDFSIINTAAFYIDTDPLSPAPVLWSVGVDIDNRTGPVMRKHIYPNFNGIHELEALNFIKTVGLYRDQLPKDKMKVKFMGALKNQTRVKIKVALLFLGLKPPKVRERRRAKGEFDKTCTNSSIYCCLKNFTVNAADLNLQNLVNLETIQLNYCRGECNNYSAQKSNHAIYLSLLKRSKNSRLSRRQLENMRSCCTPVHYKRLLIQYRDYSQAEIKQTEINDMIVSSCGCN